MPAATERAQEARAAHAAKPRRDRSIDTVVGALAVLVVVGHAIEPLESRAADALQQWIYLFHMPAFVFLSGYLTRWSSRASVGSLAARLLAPLVAFEVLHLLARVAVGDGLALSPLIPAWTLWYLLALFVWRVCAPWLARIPAPVTVTACAALVVGAVDVVGAELSLSRIVAFAPFFVAGLTWDDARWARLRTRRWRVAAVVALSAAAAWAWALGSSVPREAFFLSTSYGDMEITTAAGIVQRAGVLAAGAVLTLAVLALSGPVQRTLAAIGVASLPVYLLHPLVLYPSHVHGFPAWLDPTVALVVLVAGSAGFAWAVSRPAVVAATRPLMDLRWWRDRAAPPARTRSRPSA